MPEMRQAKKRGKEFHGRVIYFSRNLVLGGLAQGLIHNKDPNQTKLSQAGAYTPRKRKSTLKFRKEQKACCNIFNLRKAEPKNNNLETKPLKAFTLA